jgi:hypothetical protein
MSSPAGATPESKPAFAIGMRQCVRYITTHGHSGASIFGPEPELLYRERVGYGVARTYALSNVPAPLVAEADLNSYLSNDGDHNTTSYLHGGKQIVVENGVSMVSVDMSPGASTVMHRTVSIDFVIVTEGEVELELDSGEKRTLYSGVSIFISTHNRFVDKVM